MGATMMPLFTSALKTLTAHQVARGSTLLNISQQVASSIGVAIISVVLTNGFNNDRLVSQAGKFAEESAKADPSQIPGILEKFPAVAEILGKFQDQAAGQAALLDVVRHNMGEVFGNTFLVAAIMRSKAGLAFVALHDNEVVAAAAGVNVVRYRLLAMTLGGYLGGLAGALSSHTLTRHIEPGIFGLADSIGPMVYTIAGGLGTAEGPIIGTFVVRVFWEWALRRLGGFESLILVGLLLAVVVVALPRGIYPMAARAVTRAAESLAARRARLPQRQP
jgi:hypothetical protein